MARTIESLTEDVGKIAKLKSKQKKLESQAKSLQDEIDALEAPLRADMLAAVPPLEQIRSGSVTVTVKPVKKFKVVDWNAYDAYAIKTKSMDLYERRPMQSAIKARLEDKKKVPGIEVVSVISATWLGIT